MCRRSSNLRNFGRSDRPQTAGKVRSPATLKSGARGVLQDCTGQMSSGLTCEISSVNSIIFKGSALCLRYSRAHIYRAPDGKLTAGYWARRARPTKEQAGLARGARTPATRLPRPLEGASDPTPTREPHHSMAYMHMCFSGVKVAFSASGNAATDAQQPGRAGPGWAKPVRDTTCRAPGQSTSWAGSGRGAVAGRAGLSRARPGRAVPG